MLAVFLAFTVKLQIAKVEISDAGGRCERTRRRQTIPTSVGGQFLRRGRLLGMQCGKTRAAKQLLSLWIFDLLVAEVRFGPIRPNIG
jgi:hypothetical protein